MCPPAQTQHQNLTSGGKIRCVLAHEHTLLRQGLRRLLEDEPDLEVVSEVAGVDEAVKTISENQPEVVIADARTLGLSAQEAEILLLRESPHSKLVFLRQEDDSGLQNSRAGEDDGPVTPASVQELVRMVRDACHQDKSNRCEKSEQEHSEQQHGEWRAGEKLPSRKGILTAREEEVLKLLAEGSTVRTAARTLGLSAKTVDAHKFNLMRKLGIHNKAQLVMWAIQKQVVKIPANF